MIMGAPTFSHREESKPPNGTGNLTYSLKSNLQTLSYIFILKYIYRYIYIWHRFLISEV